MSPEQRHDCSTFGAVSSDRWGERHGGHPRARKSASDLKYWIPQQFTTPPMGGPFQTTGRRSERHRLVPPSWLRGGDRGYHHRQPLPLARNRPLWARWNRPSRRPAAAERPRPGPTRSGISADCSAVRPRPGGRSAGDKRQALDMARRLHREEDQRGFQRRGGSRRRAARPEHAGKQVVVILPDAGTLPFVGPVPGHLRLGERTNAHRCRLS